MPTLALFAPNNRYVPSNANSAIASIQPWLGRQCITLVMVEENLLIIELCSICNGDLILIIQL
ncbi:hypothetical protein NUACC26_017400 [Scytonema sp. NUACC26]